MKGNFQIKNNIFYDSYVLQKTFLYQAFIKILL